MTKKHLLYAILILTATAVLGLTGYWAWWNYYARWQPATITQKQAEIQTLLDQSGYASAGKEGPEMWVITYRNCDPCKAWEAEEMPKYEAMGADIRIIAFAPADIEGKVKTTASERATIAELWLNRSYALYKQWRATPEEGWMPTFRAADGDMARSAVVQASRDFVTRLEPLLGDNNVQVRYPLIIWRDGTEHIKVCACSDSRMYNFVRDGLNAPSRVGMAATASAPSTQIPSPQTPPPSQTATATAPLTPPANDAAASGMAGVSASGHYGPDDL